VYVRRSSTVTEKLDTEAPTICLCHHGVRSMNMAAYLVQQGFTNVYNVTGGIDAYSRGADSRVPTY
jgi:rhodanese-related sulfurtransferase